MQVVSCGADYITQQSWKRYFGLGDSPVVDSVVVDWPSGLHEVWTDIPAGSDLRLVEGSSQAVASVSGSNCPGDSSWLSFPLSAPTMTVNGVALEADSMLLEEEGQYVLHCAWLNGLFSWTDTVQWAPAVGHSLTVEWTEPDCFGEEGALGWSADAGLTVSFGGFNFPGTVQNVPQLAGQVELLTLDTLSGCSVSHGFSLPEPGPLNLFLEYEPAPCHDVPAQAFAAGYGGTPDYLVNWNGANPGALPEGEVTLTLTDAHGCQLDSTLIVEIPDSLFAAVTVVNEDVGGDGEIILDPQGGTSPYSIVWNTGLEGDSVLTGLGPGFYSWILSDANGCLSFGLQTILNVGLGDSIEFSSWSMFVSQSGIEMHPGSTADGAFTALVFDTAARQVFQSEWRLPGPFVLGWTDTPRHGIIVVLDGSGRPVLKQQY